MTTPQPPGPMYPPPTAPKPRIHWASYVIAAAGLVFCLIGGVTLAAGGGGATAEPSPSPVVVYVDKPGASAPAPAPATTKPAPPAAPTIEDGTWTVGVDFPAGRYRPTANVSSDCYWGIYKTGTNQDDIIANDIPGGGRPTVTLKVGQDFTTRGCGTWQKF